MKVETSELLSWRRRSSERCESLSEECGYDGFVLISYSVFSVPLFFVGLAVEEKRCMLMVLTLVLGPILYI
ncbi:unnamed protein product [Brassica napus]|uniref:(rape) hypothetical protein n=1 Tax=Brassica napus TaxID=3708 RepID=A0A816TVP8_BRANA|nr:unnamed protein product [Brassica napus]